MAVSSGVHGERRGQLVGVDSLYHMGLRHQVEIFGLIGDKYLYPLSCFIGLPLSLKW